METNRSTVRHIDPFVGIDPEHRDTVEQAVHSLRNLYEHGWQPMDVVHTTVKIVSTNDVHAVARLVLFESGLSRARDRAPDDWVAQLDRIENEHRRPHIPTSVDMHALIVHSRGWSFSSTWGPIGPLPSEWPAARAASVSHGGADAKMLARIRGLLAKAESTDFEEEASTLTEKAQELMSRYSVSDALLCDDRGRDWIRGKRFHIDSPYVAEKSALFFAIAGANNCRSVIFTNRAIVETHGSAVDIEQVDMLFTSLLVQATRAMAAARASEFGVGTTSFRKGFLTGFAARIGERLSNAGAHAAEQVAADRAVPVSDLLPTLAARRDELDAEFSRLYPRLKKGRKRSVDSAGYHSGRDAANRANLELQQRIRRGA